MTRPIERPQPSEYAPYYAAYIDLIEDGDILKILADQMEETLTLVRAVPPELEKYSYGTGKWSVREVIGHLIDTERVFGYRAFTFARGDAGPLPGMDQDRYANVSNAGSRSLENLADELQAVRASTLAFFRGLPDEAWERSGIASDYSFTVRSFPYLIAGHELHHHTGLVENYLVDLEPRA